MPRGGARVGAGRKPDAMSTVKQLERIREELRTGLFLSGHKLAESMPQLTEEALKYALQGDKRLLEFLLGMFWKMSMGMVNEDEASPYKQLHEEISKKVKEYQVAAAKTTGGSERPEAVAASGPGDAQAPQAGTDGYNGWAVLAS